MSKSKEQALADLARVVADEVAIIATLTPMQAAERAWHPGGPPLEELVETISEFRARFSLDRLTVAS